MRLSIPTQPPENDAELLERCQRIEGLTFYQLAHFLQRSIPVNSLRRKGWAGLAIEKALGACAGSAAQPDFPHLGIELKTLPLNKQGLPSESTFVTSINLLKAHEENWRNSVCWQKLKKVLWIPVEGEKEIPYNERRIGQGFLWYPSVEQARILERDWTEHMENITCGRLEEIDARMGEYLQVRPKAADAKSLCQGFNAKGYLIQTLPRGFYLRSSFTKQVLYK